MDQPINDLINDELNNKWVNFLGPKSLIGSVVDVDVTNTVSNSVRGRAVEYPSEVIAVA